MAEVKLTIHREIEAPNPPITEKQLNELFSMFSSIISDQNQMSIQVRDLSSRMDRWDSLIKLEKEAPKLKEEMEVLHCRCDAIESRRKKQLEERQQIKIQAAIQRGAIISVISISILPAIPILPAVFFGGGLRAALYAYEERGKNTFSEGEWWKQFFIGCAMSLTYGAASPANPVLVQSGSVLIGRITLQGVKSAIIDCVGRKLKGTPISAKSIAIATFAGSGGALGGALAGNLAQQLMGPAESFVGQMAQGGVAAATDASVNKAVFNVGERKPLHEGVLLAAGEAFALQAVVIAGHVFGAKKFAQQPVKTEINQVTVVNLKQEWAVASAHAGLALTKKENVPKNLLFTHQATAGLPSAPKLPPKPKTPILPPAPKLPPKPKTPILPPGPKLPPAPKDQLPPGPKI